MVVGFCADVDRLPGRDAASSLHRSCILLDRPEVSDMSKYLPDVRRKIKAGVYPRFMLVDIKGFTGRLSKGKHLYGWVKLGAHTKKPIKGPRVLRMMSTLEVFRA